MHIVIFTLAIFRYIVQPYTQYTGTASSKAKQHIKCISSDTNAHTTLPVGLRSHALHVFLGYVQCTCAVWVQQAEHREQA